MRDLEGQVALITGGARGQGRSHAAALAALGASVVAWDVPGPMHSLNYELGTQADLDETVKLITSDGGECRGMAVDVRDASAVEDGVSSVLGEYGRIDILLANAGVAATGPLWEMSNDTWRDLVDTNLTGVFHCLRAVVPVMRERHYGRIVVTSSMGGRMGIPNLAAYNASKWGVIGMAKSLALETAADGVTVNVVCPCTVATPMVLHESMYKLFAPDVDQPVPDEVIERFRRVNPIPQPWIQAEDVTRAVVYLVTDPGVLTGSVLEIGLGSSARLH
jgi:SDR family mycofactocin-dependent oxidoreductase